MGSDTLTLLTVAGPVHEGTAQGVWHNKVRATPALRLLHKLLLVPLHEKQHAVLISNDTHEHFGQIPQHRVQEGFAEAKGKGVHGSLRV